MKYYDTPTFNIMILGLLHLREWKAFNLFICRKILWNLKYWTVIAANRHDTHLSAFVSKGLFPHAKYRSIASGFPAYLKSAGAFGESR